MAWHNFKLFSCLNDDDKFSFDFKSWKMQCNEILSSSFKRENSLVLCPPTWTTYNHGEKFNKMLKNFANFHLFSVLFSTKTVFGSSVKLWELNFKVFILCFQAYLFSFLQGYVCNLGIYLPTWGKNLCTWRQTWRITSWRRVINIVVDWVIITTQA